MGAKKFLSIEDIRNVRTEHPNASLADYSRYLASSTKRILGVVKKFGTAEEKRFFAALSAPNRRVSSPYRASLVRAVSGAATAALEEPKLKPFVLSDELLSRVTKDYFLTEDKLPAKYHGRGVSGYLEYVFDDRDHKAKEIGQVRSTFSGTQSRLDEEIRQTAGLRTRVKELDSALAAQIGEMEKTQDTNSHLGHQVAALSSKPLAKRSKLLEQEVERMQSELRLRDVTIREQQGAISKAQGEARKYKEAQLRSETAGREGWTRVSRLTLELSTEENRYQVTAAQRDLAAARVQELERQGDASRTNALEVARQEATRDLEGREKKLAQAAAIVVGGARALLDARRAVEDKPNELIEGMTDKVQGFHAERMRAASREQTLPSEVCDQSGGRVLSEAPPRPPGERIPASGTSVPGARAATRSNPGTAPADLSSAKRRFPVDLDHPRVRRIGKNVVWVKKSSPRVIALPGPNDEEERAMT